MVPRTSSLIHKYTQYNSYFQRLMSKPSITCSPPPWMSLQPVLLSNKLAWSNLPCKSWKLRPFLGPYGVERTLHFGGHASFLQGQRLQVETAPKGFQQVSWVQLLKESSPKTKVKRPSWGPGSFCPTMATKLLCFVRSTKDLGR